VHRNPFADSTIRLQHPSHELPHIATRPALIDQEVVRAGERVQPAIECRLEALWRAALPERLRSDGLHRRQHVLHTMAHF
jgi:hypothetical protein